MRGGYKPMGPRPHSYDYPLPINITEIENVDFRTLGHGYVRQRKKPVVNQ